MADLFENIAPSWVTNHLYQLGDVVLYNKKLYQCTDKHTSSNDIDLDKFKPHTLADMVAGTTQLDNYADMTVVSDVVTNDDTYIYLEMPNSGIVSDKTKIATLNSNLSPFIKLLFKGNESVENYAGETISVPNMLQFESIIFKCLLTSYDPAENIIYYMVPYRIEIGASNIVFNYGGNIYVRDTEITNNSIIIKGGSIYNVRYDNRVMIPLEIYGIKS